VAPGQPVAPGQAAGASNFGTVTLAPGFMPDPNTATGTSGGSIAAQTLDPSCRGFVASTPDHILVATARFNNLRVLVNGGSADTTLVIQAFDGSYLCEDDTQGEGRNPVISRPFAPGIYKIWVGSYTQGANAPYTIGFSELSSTRTASLGGGGGAGGGSNGSSVGRGGPNFAPNDTASNFGTTTLRSGFMPDPEVERGTSGGSINAGTWNSSCRGWVAQTPDHILVAQTAMPNLRVLAHSRRDTTLVIQGPDGSLYCDDDSEGRDPIISISAAPGTYRIWVGSYEQGRNSSYKLGFTELSSTRARRLR